MIIFRTIDEADLGLIKIWRNDPNVLNYTREYRLVTNRDQKEWYNKYSESRRGSDFDQELYMICFRKDEKDAQINIGVGGFTRIQWHNRRGELSLYIADLSSRRHEIYDEVIFKLKEIGFKRFGFHKITWPVYGHDPNIELYKRHFDVEATLKEEYFWDGKLQDRIYLSSFSKEFIN